MRGYPTVLGQNDSECDLFALRRTVIASDDDLPTFAARVSGLTAWYSRIAGSSMGALAKTPNQPLSVTTR